ncbi:endonuclease V [Halobaculum limi]|uniref:endonuclease V n=1 Tax=Halobaculum limi TaxID=3031916 RepID=UPI00240608A7|nr:endonuclease V [Halobaculum sp. YSMS11]
MPTPVRPEFLPDPALDRTAMEALQRDIADAAKFTDDLDFDADAVGLDAGQASLSRDPASDPPLVAGVDQAFLDDRAVSAVVVSRGSEVVERAYAVTDLSIPYVPGLLAFREGGPIVDALAQLNCDPDLYVLDGSGRIHYRQAGIATHVGVLFDTPTVGVAKNLLCGTPRASTDGRPAGWRTPITVEDGDRVDAPRGTTIGYAYQSRQYDTNPIINPLYVSPGHRVSAETAVELVAALGGEYKLPEPTRLADAYADEAKAAVADDRDGDA